MRYFVVFFFIFNSLINSLYSQIQGIHTMFLERMVPANGEEVLFNAPILRWPHTKGKNIQYEILLSQNKDFSDGTTVHLKNLKSAFFNTHRQLSTGIWYWKYKSGKGEWSAVCNFIITNRCLPMVSPEAGKFISGIKPSHPRILLPKNTASLSLLSLNADATTILKEANHALTASLVTEKNAHTNAKGEDESQTKKLRQDAIVSMSQQLHEVILPLCQAQMIHPSKAYAEKAIAQALEIAGWNADGISSESDFTDGICMYDMALVFDSFSELLSTEQQSILAKAITLRANRFYNSWRNNIESKLLSGHVWQLLLNEFFKTAMALYGHQPEAEQWLTYAYELFLARAPVLGGRDGGWAEGAYYFTMNMETLVEIPTYIKEATGFDFIRLHPWYTNNASWLIYHIPAASSANGFGDNVEELYKAPPSYAAYAYMMGRMLQSKEYAWYARQAMDLQHIRLSEEPTLRWHRLTHLQGLPELPPSQSLELPNAQVAVEQGLAAMHSNVKDPTKDIMVSFRSSAFGAYGHILADQNTFNVLAGGQRLFYRTGYKVSMDDPHRIGWSKHTKSQNGILINGNGQPYTSDAFGNIRRFLQGKELAYAMGDASAAYKSKESGENFGLKKFNRHLLLLEPGLLVIYDELEADTAVTWSWLLHSMEPMALNPSAAIFKSTAGDFKGEGKLWSSTPLIWNLTDTFDVKARFFRNYKGMLTRSYDQPQYHLKASNSQKMQQLRFLAVISIGKKSLSTAIQQLPSSNGTLLLKAGVWTIEANLDNQIPPLLRIRSNSSFFLPWGEHGIQVKVC